MKNGISFVMLQYAAVQVSGSLGLGFDSQAVGEFIFVDLSIYKYYGKQFFEQTAKSTVVCCRSNCLLESFVFSQGNRSPIFSVCQNYFAVLALHDVNDNVYVEV